MAKGKSKATAVSKTAVNKKVGSKHGIANVNTDVEQQGSSQQKRKSTSPAKKSTRKMTK